MKNNLSLWLFFMRMKFRQRIAWILLFLYLLMTIVAVYYFFELSDKYNILVLEHNKVYHSLLTEEAVSWTSWPHFPDIPFTVWLLLLSVPYLFIFACLYISTKDEPKQVFQHLIPYICSTKVSVNGSQGNMCNGC